MKFIIEIADEHIADFLVALDKIGVITKDNPVDSTSKYARLFDELSPNWSVEPEYNLMFIRMQERYANDLLKQRGYVFLNDIHDMLGLPRTKDGQIVGWIYDEKNPTGDNKIEIKVNEKREHVCILGNGLENTMLLDFNVDGNILDKM